MRAKVELLSEQQRLGNAPETHGEPTRRGSGVEVDCKMQVEEDTDCKKKLDERQSTYRDSYGADALGQAEGKLEGKVVRY